MVRQLIALDLLVSVVAAAGWLGAGAAAATGRARRTLALVVGAAVATLIRVGVVVALAASGGWWFVQEKLTLTLPLLGAAGLAAALLAIGRPVGHPRVVVPLFMTGYAAAAGLALPLLVGYPATWSTALVTVALVGAATLATWRVTAPVVAPPHLRAGGATVFVAGLIGAALALIPGGDVDAGGGPVGGAGHVERSADLRGPAMPEPGGAVRRYTLTARQATITLRSGRKVDAWTYNGQAPGPAITATDGDLIEVTLRNVDIDEGVTVHWHGYGVPNGEDGAPGLTQDPVPPGGEFVYRFLANQVGTYWYHTHQVSDRGVRMGLYGSLVVNPRDATPAGLDLTLPVHTLAGTVILGDHDDVDRRRVAPGTPVRLRLVNTDSTPHRFALTGTGYRLVAVDGTDLNGPGELTRVGLRLPAGGRYDLAFTMPGDQVALVVDGAGPGGLRLAPGVADASVPDTAGWPELDLTTYGTSAATPFGPGSRFDRSFTLVLDRGLALAGGRPLYAHTINGRAYPAIPAQLVREGELVRFTVVNRGFETHPWHLHGHRVLVLAKDGRPPSGSPLWLDTFDVRPGEVWQVGFRATNPGVWMNHCHNLGHADQGMALHLSYDGVGTPFHDGHGG
jgi:FtsP/CotA-like multicopper oxidase with cupredoxin domain